MLGAQHGLLLRKAQECQDLPGGYHGYQLPGGRARRRPQRAARAGEWRPDYMGEGRPRAVNAGTSSRYLLIPLRRPLAPDPPRARLRLCLCGGPGLGSARRVGIQLTPQEWFLRDSVCLFYTSRTHQDSPPSGRERLSPLFPFSNTHSPLPTLLSSMASTLASAQHWRQDPPSPCVGCAF